MRPAEWIHVIVFSFFTCLARARNLPVRRRARVAGLGVAGLSATVAAAYVAPRAISPRAASVVRDWLPAGLMLLVYWQGGQFFDRVDQRLQRTLEAADRRIAAPFLRWAALTSVRNWIAHGLDAAYLLCYPMIPLSLGACYVFHRRNAADYLWLVVLPSAYLSYTALPFLQTLPPRLLHEPWLKRLPDNRVRALNLWILRHASNHANTFPSAHVAASTGAALVLFSVLPRPVGVAFIGTAVAIALATFAGRYHFALDAFAGSAVAGIVFAGVTLGGFPGGDSSFRGRGSEKNESLLAVSLG